MRASIWGAEARRRHTDLVSGSVGRFDFGCKAVEVGSRWLVLPDLDTIKDGRVALALTGFHNRSNRYVVSHHVATKRMSPS